MPMALACSSSVSAPPTDMSTSELDDDELEEHEEDDSDSDSDWDDSELDGHEFKSGSSTDSLSLRRKTSLHSWHVEFLG